MIKFNRSEKNPILKPDLNKELMFLDDDFIKNKILNIDGKLVILDRDVAEIYGVETREINQAVSRNPEKFPDDFIIELDKSTFSELITNCDRFANLKHSNVSSKVFTEQGLYMLATILKGEKATNTTIEIVKTFAKLREIRNIILEADITKNQNKATKLLAEGGKKLNSLLTKNIEATEMNIETKIELNLGFVKLSQVTSLFGKRKNNKKGQQ